MINYLHGTVKEIKERSMTLDVNGMGISLFTPCSEKFVLESTVTVYSYLHWNAENGPSLYGFQTELDRKVFLLIIDCPKIGPGIALNILSQLSAGQFLEIITTQNEQKLSSINGIGAKKSEHIIVHLKHKVQKLLSSGTIHIETQVNFIQWQQVSDVLTSLNYSKTEISKAMQHLSEKYPEQNYALDQLIRSALAYLAHKTI